MNENRFLKVVLGAVSAGHALVGLCALVSGKPGIEAASGFYGADFKAHKQFEYIIRPLGIFMIALAFLQAMAVREPKRYQAVIDVTLVVLLVRVAQRLVYRRDVAQTFGIAPSRHWSAVAFFATVFALLGWGRLHLSDDATGDA